MAFPLWVLPLLSGSIWIGTILGLVIPWLLQGRPRLPSFDDGQTIAFISDLGALDFKPLFMAGAILTIGLYLATLITDRMLRHRRMPGRSTCGEMGLSAVALIGAALGGAGLTLLTIFDNFHFTALHDNLVIVFILGNLFSAAALVFEYALVFRRRNVPEMDMRMAKRSFIMKLIYLILEVIATIAFVVAGRLKKDIDLAAVLEYVNAGLFAWFILSFIMDLKKMAPSRGYKPMPKERGLGYGNQMHLHTVHGSHGYEQMRV